VAASGHELEPARPTERFVAGLIDSGAGIGLLGGATASAVETCRPHALERLHGVTRAVQRLLDWTNTSRDQQAEAAFYSAQRRGPLVGCCGTLLALFAIQGLPVVFTSRRQNLCEWVAGTMVVRD
jgi:hypothetical protein